MRGRRRGNPGKTRHPKTKNLHSSIWWNVSPQWLRVKYFQLHWRAQILSVFYCLDGYLSRRKHLIDMWKAGMVRVPEVEGIHPSLLPADFLWFWVPALPAIKGACCLQVTSCSSYSLTQGDANSFDGLIRNLIHMSQICCRTCKTRWSLKTTKTRNKMFRSVWKIWCKPWIWGEGPDSSTWSYVGLSLC